MGAKQLNIFDVLRGLADENSETYKATIRILTNYPKNLPSPDDGYIPPIFNDEAQPPPRASSGIRIPNPPPKAVSWFRRNWPWILLGAVIVGVFIYLYLQRRKKKKEEEFRQKEGERLPKINYPEPSEGSGPVIKVERQTPVENYFEEMERKVAFDKIVEHLSNVEPRKEDDPPVNPEQPK